MNKDCMYYSALVGDYYYFVCNLHLLCLALFKSVFLTDLNLKYNVYERMQRILNP
jgi:hypothetical protein